MSGMLKEQKVIDYYVLCNQLKDTIRTGWQKWNVKRDRLESVAEHVFGVQMLAIAMKSEYQYDINLEKVILMLAIHELGEAIIGDLTQFQISHEEKEQREHAAVHQILAGLIDGDQLEQLFLEFDARETPEARFAYHCDKLECDLQCKLYDEEGCVDLADQPGNDIMDNPRVQKLLETGAPWSTMWSEFSRASYDYDENFLAVSHYAIEHPLNRGIWGKHGQKMI